MTASFADSICYFSPPPHLPAYLIQSSLLICKGKHISASYTYDPLHKQTNEKCWLQKRKENQKHNLDVTSPLLHSFCCDNLRMLRRKFIVCCASTKSDFISSLVCAKLHHHSKPHKRQSRTRIEMIFYNRIGAVFESTARCSERAAFAERMRNPSVIK